MANYTMAQSLNVFVPADSNKKYIHDIHYSAWKKGVKSLYYCRSQSIQRAETGSFDEVQKGVEVKSPAQSKKDEKKSKTLSSPTQLFSFILPDLTTQIFSNCSSSSFPKKTGPISKKEKLLKFLLIFFS